MYLFVYTSRVSLFCSLLLLLSILFQPLETVFASTEPALEVSIVEMLEVEMASGDQILESVPELLAVEPEITTEETVVTIDLQNEPDVSEGAYVATSTEEQSELEESENTSAAMETVDDIKEFVATSSPSGETVTAVVYSDSVVQFDKDACVLVSDGSFYCQQNTANENVRADGIYAFPDKDGDLEIFLQTNQELTQITFNTEEDSSPHFDSESNTMVWHRLIEDRYQIISYDVASGQETQLTTGRVNSMEPTRSGKYTVWQQWDNNWEIILFDGISKKQLTNSVEHDVSPSIRNGLVVWYRLRDGNEKSIQLYDIKTAEFTTIEDSDGGTISNPRMVVVYETTYENGDVVTKGYDLVTGEIISLDAVPVELPDTIPGPDSTGETRALLQPKPVIKEDIENDNTTPSSEPPPLPDIGEFDLVIGSSTSLVNEVGPEVATSSPLLISDLDYTLDLSTPETPSSGTDFAIEDVVIPAYFESPTTSSEIE